MAKQTSELLEALEEAILEALKHGDGKDRNDAVNAGIKLLAIKHRIRGGASDADYFAQS